MAIRTSVRVLTGFAASLALLSAYPAAAQSARGLDARAKAVIDHWTPERRAAATPRDLFIDERGLGYLRGANGLEPYGHEVAAQANPMADTTGPAVSNMLPSGGTIGASQIFSATVTDDSGVKSVSFKVQKQGGIAQSFTPTASGSTYSVSLSGFTDGNWTWWVVAKDNSARGGITTTSDVVSFTVNTGSGGGGGGSGSGEVTSSPWTTGDVKMAIGRIYFEMPTNRKATRWAGYVCSGTVVDDATAGRSLILTAAHCVYDDANKAFARNVMFIPDQMDAGPTDRICTNDPIGCWTPSHGVVDVKWTQNTFPANVKWDYAFYVVPDTGAHAGNASPSEALDGSVPKMNMNLSTAAVLAQRAWALGYSYSEDPKLMYCTDSLANEEGDPSADYWLAGCGLTGGSSGGSWYQTANAATQFDGNKTTGTIISVNSWGYTTGPGMAGPKLGASTASCVFAAATWVTANTAATCP